MGNLVVPTQCQTQDVARATHLDYSKSTHPRALNAGQDAQRILDGVVNSNEGIAERVKFDGGFRMDRPGKPLHGHAVADALACTANHYAELGNGAGAAQIANSQLTYARATKSYWQAHPTTTPMDPVQ